MTRIYGKGFRRVAGTRRSVTHARAFTAAMHVCDPTLEGHASRVSRYAEALARRLGWDEAQLDDLRLGAALHDVGKVNVRQDVLTKPGALDADELAAIRAHPVEGAWLIGGLACSRAQRCRTCSSTTSAGTAVGIRQGAGARTSRSRVGCSPSRTRSTP